MTDHTLHKLVSAKDYVAKATAFIEATLRDAIKTRGQASLLVSGGSSPKPVYEALSQIDLEWDKVTVSLIDERWVPEGADGSNATFIKNTLLQNQGEAAKFVSMVSDHKSAQEGEDTIEARFNTEFPQAVDICIMGMGTDGHTASWFPRSTTLGRALDIDSERGIVWQDASGQTGGSGFDDRITVTLPLVMGSRHVALLIPGQAKADVWTASADKDVFDAPVTTLRAAGSRLDVFTHTNA